MILAETLGTPAGIITAIASVITACALLLTAVSLLLPTLRKVRAVQVGVTEIHTIVNQQRTDLQRYQQALVEALTKAGVEVPTDQSILKAPTAPDAP